MSIFRSTFTPEVQKQLTIRQNAINGVFGVRSTKAIQYINSRNSWIRMSSSVDVNKDGGKLAKQYVLLGGTLQDNKSLRSGVGSTGNEAYSTKTPSGVNHLRGIRPMPGITSIEVKSKSAYGSLREVVVNFQCWDIRQLEDLEVLYMRPGYTVLVEWGWLPYLDNNNTLISTPPSFYDILEKPPTDRQTIFAELFQKSVDSGGNYDAMFGYVKNYQWSARADGGYDCQATVISVGEIIESLKINYVPPKTVTSTNSPLSEEFITSLDATTTSYWTEAYKKNILAGIWAEIYYKLRYYNFQTNGNPIPNSAYADLSPNSILKDQFFNTQFKSLESINNTIDSLSKNSQSQVYITLGAFFDIINKRVILHGKDEKPIIELSLQDYENKGKDPLYCVAHPLQISVDPTVCLIKNPLWSQKDTSIVSTTTTAATENPTIKAASDAFYQLLENEFNAAISSAAAGVTGGPILRTIVALGESIKNYFTTSRKIVDAISNINTVQEYTALNERVKLFTANRAAKNDRPPFTDLVSLINYLTEDEVTLARVRDKFNKFYLEAKIVTGAGRSSLKVKGPPESDPTIAGAVEIAEKGKLALENLQFLNNLTQPFFYNNDPYSEIGIIKNIYINVDFLYKKALDLNLEYQDKNGKNEINLYNYLKSVISDIQASIGNLNNFEIHVHPNDSKGRIIDINYTEPKKASYELLFPLEVHNTKSVVRSYSLQSQIFPEQSAIIAIGSQVTKGQLGMQTNTMIDFNRNLTDRIITDKIFPNGEVLKVSDTGVTSVSMLASLINLFSSLKTNNVANNDGGNLTKLISEGKNTLRDLIVYFQAIVKSPGSNRNLIPTKFSFEMDGIGGLVIGHMFKLSKDILPKGYRGEDIGSQLAQTITGIGHSLVNNDWVTKVDTLNIVLNDDQTGKSFKELNLQESIKGEINVATGVVSTYSSTLLFNANNIKTAVNFFESKGYKDYQVAAFVGGLLQESGLDPSLTNSIGAYGIAQWLGERLDSLKKINGWNKLNVQLEFINSELNGNEKAIGTKLKQSSTLEEAIAASAAYERYKGINNGADTTYSNVLVAPETGKRVGYANDLLTRIKGGEFK